MSPEMNFQMTERLTFVVIMFETFLMWFGYTINNRLLSIFALLAVSNGFLWRALYNEGFYQLLATQAAPEWMGSLTIGFYCVYLVCVLMSFGAAFAVI